MRHPQVLFRSPILDTVRGSSFRIHLCKICSVFCLFVFYILFILFFTVKCVFIFSSFQVFQPPQWKCVLYISTLLIKWIVDMYKLTSCFYLSNIIITTHLKFEHYVINIVPIWTCWTQLNMLEIHTFHKMGYHVVIFNQIIWIFRQYIFIV